ncbi:prenyltransferase [uncultured Microbacterium sp.]|uniref:prenyltransferase n=1 Tax=uncultured Microbacterium sp. TaxID=191216 RepID=UPI00260048D1|nr:prenyltransferase [uncultured Microbacterium sp.]
MTATESPGIGRVLRTLIVSSRPVSWINTAYPFGAAYLLTTREIDLTLILGVIFFLVPYNLAMYGINDVFDYESDLRNPRKGGAHGAVLDRSLHRATLWAAGLSCAPFVVYLVIVGSPLSWLVLAASLFFVVFYSAPPLRLKERPFADSLTSAIHFFSPAVYGLVLAGAAWTPGLWLIIAAFCLWGIASHAFGAVQDVVADREAQISSIATVRGAAFTVRFAIGCYALAGLLMLGTPWPGPLAAVLVVPYLVAIWPYRSLPDARATEATRGWRAFLWLNQFAGFGVTLLLIWWWLLTD